MVATGLLLTASISLATAVVYMLVARAAPRPAPGEPGRLAAGLFATWWWSLGGVILLGAGLNAGAALGVADFALHLAFLNVALLVICVALFALLYYLLYIFTGRAWFLWPLAAYYGAVYVVLEYLVAHAAPVGIRTGTWQTEFVFANEWPTDAWWLRAFWLAVILPLLAGAIGYASLVARVTTRPQRYRIAMVSGAFIAAFGASVLATALGLSGSESWQLANRFISLATALVVLAAFRPPPPVSRWLAAPPPRPAGGPSA